MVKIVLSGNRAYSVHRRDIVAASPYIKGYVDAADPEGRYEFVTVFPHYDMPLFEQYVKWI